MRMWGVSSKILCKKHLLGEHVEMHMFVGHMNKGYSIKGFLDKNLLDVKKIKERHDELAEEIKSRGYNHNSDLQEIKIKFSEYQKSYNINVEKSLEDLLSRCSECRDRYNNIFKDVKEK